MNALIVVTLAPEQKLDGRIKEGLCSAQENAEINCSLYFVQENPYGKTKDLFVKRQNIAANLNQARKVFLDNPFDYFINIDSDTLIPPFAISEMLVADSDVAVGLYRFRYPGHNLSCAKQGDGMPIPHLVQLTEEDLALRFVQVHWFGFGCTLIRRKAIQAIEFEATKGMGPDYNFAWRCLDKGFKAMCCTKVLCGHLLPDGTILSVQ